MKKEDYPQGECKKKLCLKYSYKYMSYKSMFPLVFHFNHAAFNQRSKIYKENKKNNEQIDFLNLWQLKLDQLNL